MKRLTDTRADAFLALFLILLCIATITDLFFDNPDDWTSPHVIIEGFVFVTSLVAFMYLIRRVKTVQTAIRQVNHQLHLTNEEAVLWKNRAGAFLVGLSNEIHSQFDSWKLTNAEREVALLLLKGFSHGEIARISNRSERTVRQHSGVVYQKSGLTGRAELAAFFLEDLLAAQVSSNPGI